MEEAAEGVAAVTALCHAQELAAERGGGARAGRVEGGQRGVDAALQGFRVLPGEQRERQWFNAVSHQGQDYRLAHAHPAGSGPVRSGSAKRPDSRQVGFLDAQLLGRSDSFAIQCI